MEYVLLVLALGIVGGCAIGGYGLLDAVEREEYQDLTRAAERARGPVLEAMQPTLPTVSSPRPSSQDAGRGEVEADRFDGRIRSLERRLDRLERACRQVEASRQGRRTPVSLRDA